jgi:ABC-type sulfate transport system permease component
MTPQLAHALTLIVPLFAANLIGGLLGWGRMRLSGAAVGVWDALWLLPLLMPHSTMLWLTKTISLPATLVLVALPWFYLAVRHGVCQVTAEQRDAARMLGLGLGFLWSRVATPASRGPMLLASLAAIARVVGEGLPLL